MPTEDNQILYSDFYFLIACCWPNYTAHREIQENLKMLHITRRKQHQCQYPHQHVDFSNNSPEKMKNNDRKNKWNHYQMKVWEMLDEPYSSKFAKVKKALINVFHKEKKSKYKVMKS